MKIYNKSNAMLHAFQISHEMNKLRAEVKEHRYFQEKSVARRTEYLSLRIGVLESCNKTLCNKLASTKKALAQMQRDSEKPDEGDVKLYLLNKDAQRVA